MHPAILYRDSRIQGGRQDPGDPLFHIRLDLIWANHHAAVDGAQLLVYSDSTVLSHGHLGHLGHRSFVPG